MIVVRLIPSHISYPTTRRPNYTRSASRSLLKFHKLPAITAAMFDNICTLPLSSDVFAQAIHPTQPIFSVGLASGHVQTFRLPPIGEAPQANGPTSSIRSTGRRLSETGFDTIDIVWQTRRHKGSCRALAFGTDGKTLYSAGTDGIVKVAETETGRATSKIAVPLYGYGHVFLARTDALFTDQC